MSEFVENKYEFNKLMTCPVSRITPYGRNPRVNHKTIDALKLSIRSFGSVAPILVDKEFVIIAGHARFKALLELDYKEVNIVMLNLSPKKVKEYRILDNKIQELTIWNYELIKEQIDSIPKLKDFSSFFDEFKAADIPDVSSPFTEDVGGDQGPTDAQLSDEESEDVRGMIAHEQKEKEENRKRISCPQCGKHFEEFVIEI